jgi:hypothetical protein
MSRLRATDAIGKRGVLPWRARVLSATARATFSEHVEDYF